MSKFLSTPLMMICTLGVVTGVVGIVAAVLLDTRLLMLFRKIEGVDLQR